MQIVGFLLIFLIFAAPLTAQAQTFLLQCRGGSPMRFAVFVKGGRAEVEVTFKAGTGPASQGLLPGQCSWLDRGFRPGEPPFICHRIGAVDFFFSSPQDPNVANLLTHSVEAPYLADLRHPTKFWTFRVFNEGRCMRVSAG